MNFIVYFERLDEVKVLPEHQTLQHQALQHMRSRNLTPAQQRSLLDPFLKQMKDPELDYETAWKEFRQKTGEQKVRAAAEWMDFFPFFFLYSGLYEAGFDCIIGPMIDGKGMLPFELGWSSVLQAVWVYLIFKAVFFIMDSSLKKWQRWLGIGVLFAAYLGGIYVTRFVPGAISINPLLWIVILAIPAWASWQWLKKNGYISSSRT